MIVKTVAVPVHFFSSEFSVPVEFGGDIGGISTRAIRKGL